MCLLKIAYNESFSSFINFFLKFTVNLRLLVYLGLFMPYFVLPSLPCFLVGYLKDNLYSFKIVYNQNT